MLPSLFSPVKCQNKIPQDIKSADENRTAVGGPQTTDCYICKLGSPHYYALCGLGGVLSCSIIHTAMVPLDMVKCRSAKYKTVLNGFKDTVKEDGFRALALGWAPTFFVCGAQGLFQFGLYEVFKDLYSDIVGKESAFIHRTSIYLTAGASAEFFADIALSPMQAVKIKIQTSPVFATTLRQAWPKIYAKEGVIGFYKSLVPLWMRQVPYTMMKFACFERTKELLYKHVVPKPRSECSMAEELVVSFGAGYIAGVVCAVVSHPADAVVSKLHQEKGSSALEAAKKLGMSGLWKGLIPRIVIIGTLTALQWFIYDGFKVAMRMPRPPPPEMPDSMKNRLEQRV